MTSPDTQLERREIPVHGYANPQDLEPHTDIFDTIVDRAESAVRIAGMLGHFAAQKAVDGLEIFTDKLGRIK